MLRESGNASHLVSLLRIVVFSLVSVVGRDRHVDIVGGNGLGDERSVMREDAVKNLLIRTGQFLEACLTRQKGLT